MKFLDGLTSRLLKAAPLPAAKRASRDVDSHSVSDTIERALSAAGLTTGGGAMQGVAGSIRQALDSAGIRQGAAAGRPHAHAAAVDAGEAPNSAGQFLSGSFANAAGSRDYRLHVPAGYSADAAPVPLLVMLHGCTQSPEDFATGTRMSELADQHGFLVLYPAQASNANGSKCWNWFRAQDQTRDAGEPSLIAGITREVASSYRVDEQRIFVAGLSAGAAMAVILGATYPELYAAVGAHSGLPYRAATDMGSAFSAMKGAGSRAPDEAAQRRGVPTIVFHGDRDHTVDARNGLAIVEQAVAGCFDAPELQGSTTQGRVDTGRTYGRTVYSDAVGAPVVEHWQLHGAGHAWSGGSSDGSYTDAQGPDASAEMLRFFNAQTAGWRHVG